MLKKSQAYVLILTYWNVNKKTSKTKDIADKVLILTYWNVNSFA